MTTATMDRSNSGWRALNPTRMAALGRFGFDLEIVRAEGCLLYGADGRAYLDFLAQYGAAPFGHNPPELWDVVDRVRRDRPALMVQPMAAPSAVALAERLADLAPGDLRCCVLANSGAETVEAAIKLARARTGRRVILSVWNGFHGKTLGALSATGRRLYQTPFGAPAPDFEHVAAGDLAALEARLALRDDVAAFIVEPIQGEGGVVAPPAGYLDAAIALCRRYGALSVVDEIQTGLGRTGALFVTAEGRETPDMLLLSKALGGGLVPIGACLVRPEAWSDEFGMLHSSTFANNGLACSVALGVLDLLTADDGALLRRVRRDGAHLRARLDRLKTLYPEAVADVRSHGYMAAVEFRGFEGGADSATLSFCSMNAGLIPLFSSHLLHAHGLVTAPLFNDARVMRLQPPLIAGRAEIDRAADALEALCDALGRRDHHAIVRHLPGREAPASPAPGRPTADRVASAQAVTPADPTRFAFLLHYTGKDDVIAADPSFAAFGPDELDGWLRWVSQLGPGFVRRLPGLATAAGGAAEGWAVSLPLLPADMTGRNRAAAEAMVHEAIALAASRGVGRVGLGAFTSIATKGGATATGLGVSITSGNTLTTVAAVDGMAQAMRRAGLPLATSRVAVVGASGAVGRLAALMLARRAGGVILVGNPGNPFAAQFGLRVADEVCRLLADAEDAGGAPLGEAARTARRLSGGRGGDTGRPGAATAELARRAARAGVQAPVTWTLDIAAALEAADAVLLATSADEALIDARRLKPGMVVCDVARPRNVAGVVPGGPVIAFEGGLVEPPFPVDLGPMQVLPTGLCWGCLGETMLLSLAGETRDYSIGANLAVEDADHLAALARRHGFRTAPLQFDGVTLGEADFRRAAEARRAFGGGQRVAAQ